MKNPWEGISIMEVLSIQDFICMITQYTITDAYR